MGWVPKASGVFILQALRLFNAGYNAGPATQLCASLLFFSILLGGLLINLRKHTEKLWLLIAWLFLPMLLSVLLSGIISTFTYRNFIICLPAYYLLLAFFIAKLKKYAILPLVFYVAIASFSLVNYYKNTFLYPEDIYHFGIPEKRDNRTAANYIAANFKEGDVVLHTFRHTILPYIYYHYAFNHDADGFNEFSRHANTLIKENEALDFCANSLVDKEVKIKEFAERSGCRRIWLVFSAWERQKLAEFPAMEENKVKQWLKNNWREAGHKAFSGIDIYLYERPITK